MAQDHNWRNFPQLEAATCQGLPTACFPASTRDSEYLPTMLHNELLPRTSFGTLLRLPIDLNRSEPPGTLAICLSRERS
jgi:hypothetical protein